MFSMFYDYPARPRSSTPDRTWRHGMSAYSVSFAPPSPPTSRPASPVHHSARCSTRYKCGVCGSSHDEHRDYVLHLRLHTPARDDSIGQTLRSSFL
ncbi:hypothetical protein M407DRAFT_240699 [Tulasnella calospora MUT 4182]|uniref:C2H2-type domain-containing protein n=1 Tax=Tulasnella calospora MUT 4182 TaxID=1051891 RepID=A0A0C3LK43_9AGAM|nr:hypothetical protein M407DRAFT_240699 [Tulasnella calospora MUT 4182]